MKGRSKWFLFVAFLLINVIVTAQNRQDSAFMLNRDQFISIVRTYHPIMQQAALQVSRAKAEVMQARGAFDPSIDASLERKTFDNKLYYSYFNPQITIPTWYGVDIKMGVEEIVGTRVTQEATRGQSSYVGIKVPANNLMFDSRRAVLRQAQTLQQLTEAERLLTINDLLFDALASYWNWVREYQIYRIINDAVKVNQERLRFVRIEFEQGARPAIDTTESLAQLQNFYAMQNAAWLAFQNAGLELSNYMWLENNVPMAWNSAIRPVDSVVRRLRDVPSLDQLLTTARAQHPKLQSLNFKLDVLNIERRLKTQYLMPRLYVNANLLNRGYNPAGKFSIPFFENNNKVGIDLSLPLFFREARGALQATRFKIQETGLQQDQTELLIDNKIKSYYNEVLQIDRQIEINEQAYNNYVKLFQGERLRFEVGESTLFLLNTRETKVLETAQKLFELRAKWHKSYAGLLWAAGQLR